MQEFSKTQARKLILSSQMLGGNLKPLGVIEHLGYVQIDTISVVERAHHHVFWSRCLGYRPSDLDEMLSKREVFEYWSHAASYLPMRDYRFSLSMKKKFKSKESSWFPRDAKMMKAVLQRVESEGPLRSKDFDSVRKGKSGWWDWKPAKMALERLFMEGSLEVTRREGFQKVYDLPHRVIPTSVDTHMPNDDEYYAYLIERTLRHHGLASVDEVAYLKKKNSKEKIKQRLMQMCEEGVVTAVKIKDISIDYYALTNILESPVKSTTKIHLLSPFDNLVIQRKKLSTIFDYNYQIECYVPKAKRQYGYFCLPVFKGHQAIARIDCKADRKNKRLLVNSIHYEKGINQDREQAKIEHKLKQFADFNGCVYG